MVEYKHNDIVTTKDGTHHRVLWQTKRDAHGNQLKLCVVRLDCNKKHVIEVNKIIANETVRK